MSITFIMTILKAIRFYQWPKNFLVFIPMLASHQLTSEIFFKGVIGFFIFSFAASSVYVLNDLIDLKVDQKHPKKKFRPIASGQISLRASIFIIFFFLLISSFLSYLDRNNLILIILLYFFMNIFYSIKLKQVKFLDIFFLSLFYTLRLFTGSLVTGISVSIWLLIFSLFLFFSLGSIKRYAEISNLEKINFDKVLGRNYTSLDLPIIKLLSIGFGIASIMILGLYINSDAVIILYSNPKILWTICIILAYWIYHLVSKSKLGLITDDPIIFAYKDLISWLCCLLMIGIIFLGI